MTGYRLCAITFVAGGLLLGSAAARASCGSAFCTLDTDFGLPGGLPGAGLRLNLRYEYIDQDQPRHGSEKVGVGEIHAHHDEVRTVNRNWLASADYAFNPDWGVTVTAPFARRDHVHIHNHHGAQFRDEWEFTELGDVQLLGRRQWQLWRGADDTLRSDSVGINVGLKLPTGRTGVENGDGDPAERTLQPGTGTTDLLLGAFYQSTPTAGDWSWFGQALYQAPTNSHDRFRPGDRFTLNLGGARKLTDTCRLLLQVNAVHRGRDEGRNAEPEDSGGNSVFLSPGASWALTPRISVYGFVQKPIYQYVNGVQLTADWSAVAGIGFSL